MHDESLNIASDARTNQPVDPGATAAGGAHDLQAARRAWAETPMIPRALRGRDDGIDNSWPGFDVRTILVGEESGGRFTFHNIVLAPGAGLPAHHLPDADSYWYVAGGTVELTIGDRVRQVGSGAFGYAPRETTQAIRNASPEPARVVLWQSPAGYERAFAALHAATAAGADDAEARLRTLERFGVVVHRGPVTLANDARVNAAAARLDASIGSFDDFARLREEWSRRAPTPKLIERPTPYDRIALPGQDTAVLVSGDDTAGAAVVFHLVLHPGYGAPPHYQPSEEEIFLILDGELRLTVGTATAMLGPNAFGFSPRHGTHAFKNVGPGLVRMITINAPAGHERGFEMLSTTTDEDRLGQVLVDHGWRMHPPADA